MKEQMNLYDDAYWQDASEYGSGAKKKILRDENGKKYSVEIIGKFPHG